MNIDKTKKGTVDIYDTVQLIPTEEKENVSHHGNATSK